MGSIKISSKVDQAMWDELRAMAGALFESLLMNRPFVGGNNRVAFFATDVFLRLNGWRLEVDPDDAHAFVIGLLERRQCDLAHLLSWLSAHLVQR